MVQSRDDNNDRVEKDARHDSSGRSALSALQTSPSTDVERKLQLLECRFTMPLSLPYSASTYPAAAIATTTTTTGGSSPATLDPENSSPLSFPFHPNSSNSHHSFGFDTPSLLSLSLHSETKRISTSPPTLLHPHEALFSTTTTKTRQDESYPEWQKLAVQHMEKIASEQQQPPSHEMIMMMMDGQSQDRTLLTSHVETTLKKVEPASLSGVNHTSMTCQTLDSPARSTATASQTRNVPKSKPAHKRKSVVPSKRNHHSVKDSLLDRCTTVAVDATSTVPLSPNKRARVEKKPLSPRQQQELAITATSHISPSSHLGTTGSPLKAMSSPTAANASARNPKDQSKGNLKKQANHAKISNFFPSNRKLDAVKGNEKVLTKHIGSNLRTGEVEVAVTGLQSTWPNTAASSNGSTTLLPQENRFENAEFELLQHRYKELEQVCQDKDKQLKAVSNNRTIQNSALQSALRQREHELDDLRDATESQNIKARGVFEDLVRSNACRQARELREALAMDSARLGRLVTVPAPQTSGPPRLMMMMQRGVTESWEEGHAAKELAQKRRQLELKRVHLEKRLRIAHRTNDKVRATHSSDTSYKARDSQHGVDHIEEDGLTESEEDLPTPLDATEAIESARFHLDSLCQEEKDLVLEERSLQDQKGVHIRALKRVANEDASRFRVRPKLHDRYVLCSLLGKGGFSEVWRAYDIVEFREVAVKIHELDARWPESKKENYTKHVSREYEIHRTVRHPRIVSLYDVFEIDNNSFATVLESCDGTDLDALLKLKRCLPERDARVILLQILSGMNYLSHPSTDGSRQGIIHYDLKPGNILFDKHGDAKITDFGLSKIVESGDPAESMELTSQGAGTYWYLPPECFVVEEHVRISNKVDVWSIGVIFYQMLFGKRPFGDGQSQDKILTDGVMLNAHTVIFPEKPDVTEACKDFIRACLTYDQKHRLSIAQLCHHLYVKTYSE